MNSKLIAVSALICVLWAGASHAVTPGDGRGASQAHPSSTPTCQGYGLGFLNKDIKEAVIATSGGAQTNLGQFWIQNEIFGEGPGASKAISTFFVLDTIEGACEAAFGMPPR